VKIWYACMKGWMKHAWMSWRNVLQVIGKQSKFLYTIKRAPHLLPFLYIDQNMWMNWPPFWIVFMKILPI
jgi:hypothetical protein